MSFSEQDLVHSLWMMSNQIESPFDLIALWLLFPNEVKWYSPRIERTNGMWFKGLEKEIEKTA